MTSLIWWAWRERIRTLPTDKGIVRWYLEGETFLTKWDIEYDPHVMGGYKLKDYWTI